MAMNPRLELRQTQRLLLTPALRTGLSVLRMTPLDLAEEVSRRIKCPGIWNRSMNRLLVARFS